MAYTVSYINRNYSPNDNLSAVESPGYILPPIEEVRSGWGRTTYVHIGYNTSRDGTGTDFPIGAATTDEFMSYFAQYIPQTFTTNTEELLSIADAIRAKGETIAELEYPDGFVDAIEAISTGITPSGTISITQDGVYNVTAYASADVSVGGGQAVEVSEKDVNFYDYDGTRVYSYTTAEALALTAMPTNPSHAGLTAQGWNWTLADMKAHLANCPVLDVGQMYVTDDGKTRIYLHIPKNASSRSAVRFTFSSTSGTVDWGDGTTGNITSGLTPSHTYAAAGDYVVKITLPNNATVSFQGLTNRASGTGTAAWLGGIIKKIEFGIGITTLASAFRYCRSVETVTMPNTITRIAASDFEYSPIRYLTIPSGVTEISNYVFRYSGSIKVLSLPKSLTTIGNYFCAARVAAESAPMMRIVIPEGVTEIGTYFLYQQAALCEVHFAATVPPVLGSFSLSYKYACIFVPYSEDHSILDAYKTAENWSSLANYILEEPAPV